MATEISNYFKCYSSNDDCWHLEPNFDSIASEDARLDAHEGLSMCVPSALLEVCVDIEHPGPMVDFNRSGLGAICVSEKFRTALEPWVGDTVQYIPARLKAPGRWYFANLLRSVDCIDPERSVRAVKYPPGHEREGRFSSVFQMAIRHRNCVESHWFRPARWRVAMLMSRQAKDALHAAGVTGIGFFPTIPAP